MPSTDTQFKKGQNPRDVLPMHRERGKGLKSKIRAVLEEKTKTQDGREVTREEAIVIKAALDAEDGNRHARNFIFDRLHGKPVQPTKNEHTGANGGPIQFSQEQIEAKKAEIIARLTANSINEVPENNA